MQGVGCRAKVSSATEAGGAESAGDTHKEKTRDPLPISKETTRAPFENRQTRSGPSLDIHTHHSGLPFGVAGLGLRGVWVRALDLRIVGSLCLACLLLAAAFLTLAFSILRSLGHLAHCRHHGMHL